MFLQYSMVECNLCHRRLPYIAWHLLDKGYGRKVLTQNCWILVLHFVLKSWLNCYRMAKDVCTNVYCFIRLFMTTHLNIYLDTTVSLLLSAKVWHFLFYASLTPRNLFLIYHDYCSWRESYLGKRYCWRTGTSILLYWALDVS
jgi:hypothetical protein